MSWLATQQKLGAENWRATYGLKGHAGDDSWCAQYCLALVQKIHPGMVGDEAILRSQAKGLMSAAKWVDGGCRMLTTSSEYFASMAATKVAPDVGLELRIPWPAFVVEIPKGLLVASDGAEYRYLIAAQFRGVAAQFGDRVTEHDFAYVALYQEDGEGACLHSYTHGTLADCAALEDLPFQVDAWPGLSAANGDEAILNMARRAVIGLLLTMQHTTNFRAKAYTGVTRGQYRDTPPPHRVIFIGKPLRIDCSQAVRDAAAGRRSAPSVQTLVRGHVKRQVFGPGRVGRKVVWIEPYWRGPEDAPILSRPYRVDGGKS